MTAKPQPLHEQGLLRQTLAGTRFVKIAGPVGDWIVFYDAADAITLTEKRVIALCDRVGGVGARGVVLIAPAQDSSSGTTPQSRIEAWHADGAPAHNMTEPARAATCGLAVLNKISVEETSHHIFESNFGPITTVYTPSYIGVDIGQWAFTEPNTAEAAGSDVLVMAAGLTDPRPGLSVHIQTNHVTIAVESVHELETIDLEQQPSLEPPPTMPTSTSFVVPQDPLMDEQMGQLRLRSYTENRNDHDLASAAAAATVAFQTWSGLKQLKIWNVATEHGDIVVQMHEKQRLSTFAKLSTAFFGTL
ncbi:MAG: hypothetical protein HLX51_11115 [Micrococcaceae bacterium]|nr:hypothetical protein [Micrococcaceae bacterium]